MIIKGRLFRLRCICFFRAGLGTAVALLVYLKLEQIFLFKYFDTGHGQIWLVATCAVLAVLAPFVSFKIAFLMEKISKRKSLHSQPLAEALRAIPGKSPYRCS